MASVRLSWDLPPVTARQRAIAATRIEVRVAGATTWTVQDNVAPDGLQELLMVDVVPGDYEYQGTVVDVDGVEGPPVQTTASVPFDPPGPISAFMSFIE